MCIWSKISNLVMVCAVAVLGSGGVDPRTLAASTLGDVTIGTDTLWAEGTYDADTLTVTNGATLTVGGGSTVNVAGNLQVSANSLLRLQGKNVSQQVDGTWQGTGVTVNAGSLKVDSGSAISADGQGYVGTAGPGAGASEQQCNAAAAGGGGGYGATGGDARLGARGGTTYGSAVTTTDLGSGGGNNPGCSQTSTANAGGGAIVLSVGGTLQLNGTITATGAAGLPARLGGGAGGSVYVTAATLTGSGVFSADGADGGNDSAGGGAGGRIAVYYASAPSFTGFAASSANGGAGFTAGAKGTVAFFETSTTPPHLLVYQDLVFGADSTLTYEAITLDNMATLRVGGGSTVDVSGAVTLKGNSSLLLQGKNTTDLVVGEWQGEGVTISAADVTVETGSTISADGQGYVGAAGLGAGTSEQMCSGSAAGGGGGYGGDGGRGALGAAGGTPYGSPVVPSDLGSGGGNNPGCNVGSTVNAGGGAIVLNVAGALQLDGRISANAASALPARLGGGAGGSIHVTSATLTGSGFFSADGASGGNDSAGGGSGGRIVVYYETAPVFTGFVSSTANGGAGFKPGQPGTVAFFDTTTSSPHVYVYQNLVFGEDSMIAYESITLDNRATLRVGGGSTVDASNALALIGNSTLLLAEGRNRMGLLVGAGKGAGVTINAGDVTVQAGSTISADGQGYIGTAGPGAGASEEQCNASAAGAGGGHGGVGGSAALGARGGSPYGSATAPTDLGSGGGNNPGCNVVSTVDAGGGAVALHVTATLQLDGSMTADAAGNLLERLGGGAGGSIYVTTRRLIGSGHLSAAGAAGGNASSGGGGGGRIAVYYEQGAAFTGFTASVASGGSGQEAGEDGTANFVDTVCDGDCDGDGMVTVDELIKAVNVALGLLEPSTCPAVDSDGGEVVTIDDLIRAVTRALSSCTAG